MRFSCLPAALEMDILMAVRVRLLGEQAGSSGQGSSSKVTFTLKNTTKRFEPTSFESDVFSTDCVELQHSGGTRWANYFKAAYKVSIIHVLVTVSVLSLADSDGAV